MTGTIGFEQNGHVAIITIDRPDKLNAMTPDMAGRLVELAGRCNSDDDIRAIVLTGAGTRSFSAGSDIRALDGYLTPWSFRQRQDYCDAVRRITKPVIAAINGYAFGGGLETAMSCDIRLASENASFAAPEVKLGWIGGGGMATFLRSAAGPSNAALMLMTGNPIDAETALRWGIVSESASAGRPRVPRERNRGDYCLPRAGSCGNRQAEPVRRRMDAVRKRDRI
jgi:enoyl-CoA hydratase/carnithine racemase